MEEEEPTDTVKAKRHLSEVIFQRTQFQSSSMSRLRGNDLDPRFWPPTLCRSTQFHENDQVAPNWVLYGSSSFHLLPSPPPHL